MVCGTGGGISLCRRVHERPCPRQLSPMTVLLLPCTERGRALLMFLVLLASYGYLFPRLNNWESNSRIDLIYAPADQGRCGLTITS
jgi:hypothetical protein